MPAWASGAWATGAWAGTAWAETGITVPDVVGETQAAGTATLEGDGFVVAVVTAHSSTVPAGEIISQQPQSGAEVPEGSTVTITVSLGEAPAQDEGNSGGWAFFLKYEQERDRRRKKRREIEEAEEAAEQLPDPVDKEIAQLLQKQEREDEKRTEIERLRTLVKQHADDEAQRALTQRAREALERVKARQTPASLYKFDKELRRQLEEEEMAILLLLING